MSLGLLWNLVEAGVAFWSGGEAGSVALLAYGLDSLIELFAGGILVWRLTGSWTDLEERTADVRARRLLAATFFLLAAYIVLHSGASFLGWLPRAEASPIGIGLVVASALVMTALYVGKMRVAAQMQSRSLRAEAVESLVCDLQDMSILVGLVLNALFAWWWADPLAVLILIPFLIKEGRENLAHEDHDEDGIAIVVCFCRSCFGLRTCRAACCQE